VTGVQTCALPISYEFAESLLFAWIYLAAVLGFTFFFSSLFKSSSMSIIVTTILFIFVFSLIQALVANLVKIEPWFILTYGAGIIGNILTVPYPDHIHTDTFGPGGRIAITTYKATIPEGLAILGLYFIITVVLGLLFFERKEFT
jgi:ABC-type transport system involved in multi-copper enzyme maturation permease subunit